MVKKCPYCFEDLKDSSTIKCPHCYQHLIDGTIEVEYHGVQKKRCIFCGKKILEEAKFCKYCRKWVSEVDDAVNDLGEDDVQYG